MSKRETAANWAKLVMLQKILSLFFSALALVFPLFIYHRYGFAVLAVHNKFGHVIGYANYFLLSLGLSALALLVSWLSYIAVRKILGQPRKGG